MRQCRGWFGYTARCCGRFRPRRPTGSGSIRLIVRRATNLKAANSLNPAESKSSMASDPSASDPLADQVLYIQLLQEKNRLLRRNRQSKVDESTREREGGFNTYFNGGNQILAKRLEERRFLEKNRAAAAGTSQHLMIFHFHLDSVNHLLLCVVFHLYLIRRRIVRASSTMGKTTNRRRH
jgi:hypothetical protein